ncbi:hypothetical protein CEXT_487141 [Caerostris extrusa]|uniref:Uncharacterized protein n=1 Tax=Caerostris extrusa TaxID=172846 RepID=A0AAV4MHV3_CAEEX|nr:hypothetical protein CEXT_487141 [Caerostris extrusa]
MSGACLSAPRPLLPQRHLPPLSPRSNDEMIGRPTISPGIDAWGGSAGCQGATARDNPGFRVGLGRIWRVPTCKRSFRELFWIFGLLRIRLSSSPGRIQQLPTYKRSFRELL